MYPAQLAPDRGMLFDFARVEPTSRCGCRTPTSRSTCSSSAPTARSRASPQNTEPLSTRTIPSGEPVLAVLEVIGGTAARLGIKPGDRVEHPLFKR